MRDGDPGAQAAAAPPSNVLVEQALLGALLISDDAWTRVPRLEAAHFYDPVHARIFAVAQKQRDVGAPATPVSLRHFFADDEGLAQIGGPQYLVSLASSAITASTAAEHAGIVIALAQRRRIIAAATAAAEAAADMGQPIDTAIGGFEAEAAAVADWNAKGPRTRSAVSVVTEAVDAAVLAYQAEEPSAALTGLGPLDALTRGWRAGHHVILGGRPSMGKSAVACAVAWRVAAAGHPVLFLTCEMTPVELTDRVLAEVSGERHGTALAYSDVPDGKLSEAQMRGYITAAKDVAEMPLWICDAPGIRLGELASEVRAWARRAAAGRTAPPVVILDYLQLVQAPGRDNRAQEVGEVSRTLKALARSTGACIVSLAQLSRKLEGRDDKRPQLSDLRDSGEIEQDADSVLFVYRDEYYAEREKPDEAHEAAYHAWLARMEDARGRVEIIQRKARHGPIGMCRLNCNLALNRFWE